MADLYNSIFQKTPENKEFNSPTPNEITLMAGAPNSGSAVLDSALCKEIADCGFNAVRASISQNVVEESLNNCERSNLKLFLHNGNLLYYTESFVKKFKDFKSLGGWSPELNIVPSELKETEDEESQVLLYQAYEKIYETDNIHPILIGLSGDWERDKNDDPIANYPRYIALFQRYFKPSFWLYSYFPDLVSQDSGTQNSIPEDRILTFFKDLQYYAYVARYTATPFWVFCRCQAWKDGSHGLDAPTPTLRTMRGIVFSSLAYGAQGIYYWNYRQYSGLQYFDAPINTNGQKTGIWDVVRTVNEEVKAFNDVFCGCEMLDCRHFTSISDTKWLKSLGENDSFGPILGGIVVSLSSKYDILFSQIFNRGKNYLIVVVNPLINSTNNALTLRFKFSDYWKIYLLKKSGIGYSEDQIYNLSVKVNIFPGDIMIFRWE